MNEHDLSGPVPADLEHAPVDTPLAVGPSAETSNGTPSLYVDERVVCYLSDIVAPAFPVPREPNHLIISVRSMGAWVRAIIDGHLSSYAAQWPQDSAAIEDPALNVRNALEDFRQECSSYLNAVDADDLLAQVSSIPPAIVWEHPGDPSPPHQQAWDAPEVQDALHTLSWYGYALFDSLFKDARLREDVRALRPGDRLEVHWYPGDGRQHQLPWGLMYLQPSDRAVPVDPMQFPGLRFRLEVFNYPPDRVKPCLGALREQTPRSYCLYWDDTPQEISSEVRRQRSGLDRWPGGLVLPTEGVGSPRDELLEALNRRGPNPHVLYMFCRCHNPEKAPVELRFKNGNNKKDSIRAPDLTQLDLTNNPLIFINACETSARESGAPHDLERYFFNRKCGAYIGTEAKVPVHLASRVAEGFFHYFYGVTGPQPLPVGEALARIKLILWKRYRNVGGIFYSLINDPRLHVCSENSCGPNFPHHNGNGC
jgi:hypothetical protein